ncbi:MAG: PBP1A family penicillin-binding protein [Christensenellales bacterium]|nr:PBP1A family penicillin-binding protein [Christensenellales bacterium]
MKKKIGYVLTVLTALGIAAIIWALDIPSWQRLDLNRIYAQPRSSVVYDAAGNPVGALSSGERRLWLPIADIPHHVKNAFIAAEDQQFYSHCGINPRRILAALMVNLKSGDYSQGASTITQQLIKLTHLSNDKTLSRKVQEILLSLQLEQKLSKDEILEAYLNTIYFGRGAYGISSAAFSYFQKDVSQLTLAESATLAGIIKAPSYYAPHLNSEKSLQRRDRILHEMAECGFITEEQAQSAIDEPLQLRLEAGRSNAYGWYLDATLDEAASLLDTDADSVLTGGYAIQTGFEPALQDAANLQFSDSASFPVSAADGTAVQSAMVAIRPATGEICALIGGRSYDVQRGLNRATQIRRSPGSTIKPLSSFAAAIDRNHFVPTSLVEDTPRTFSGGYAPSNAGGGSYGTVTLREALSRSLNIATVDLADLMGVSTIREYAVRFGLPLSSEDSNLSLALGSMAHGVSPAELCGAYSALANGGVYLRPHLIRSINDRNGQVVYQATKDGQQAVTDATAFMLTDMLTTAADSGSARALSAVPIPIAGKTGTVSDPNGSSRDLWTAAYTPDLAVTVWMGYDRPDAAHQLSSSEGGSGYPARLCADFFLSVSSRLSGADFSQPSSVRTLSLDALALKNCEVLLATENTPEDFVTTEFFHADALPTDYSYHWRAPESVSDLTLASGSGEIPILRFTSRSNDAEYLILRICEDETRVAACLSAPAGEIISFADTQADPNRHIDYAVLPRHRLLYEQGELLTGNKSNTVHHSPGGFFQQLFGSKPAPDEPELQTQSPDSLFQ